MSLCNIPDVTPGTQKICGEPGSHPLNCLDEIPFEKRALAAAGTAQVFSLQPDENEWQIVGVILDVEESVAYDLSVEDFKINVANYDAIVGSSSTATVVSGAAYAGGGFLRKVFYHYGNRQGSATPFPPSIAGQRATQQKSFSFSVTNDHASATKNAIGTVVIVRRKERPVD